MWFVLEELVPWHEINALPGFEEATPDIVRAALKEAAALAEEVIAPTNVSGRSRRSPARPGWEPCWEPCWGPCWEPYWEPECARRAGARRVQGSLSTVSRRGLDGPWRQSRFRRPGIAGTACRRGVGTLAVGESCVVELFGTLSGGGARDRGACERFPESGLSAATDRRLLDGYDEPHGNRRRVPTWR